MTIFAEREDSNGRKICALVLEIERFEYQEKWRLNLP